MLIFEGSFGSYAIKQLVVDHINYNKDAYIDYIEGDFSKYVEEIRKNGEWSGIVELFSFSNMMMFELSFGVMLKILLLFIELENLYTKK